MKKKAKTTARLIIIGVIICIFVCGLTGCGAKDDTTPQNPLSGKYYLVPPSNMPDDASLDVLRDAYLQFTDGGTVEVYDPRNNTMVRRGTYTLDGHTLTMVPDESGLSSIVNVSPDYDTLTFSDSTSLDSYQYRRR